MEARLNKAAISGDQIIELSKQPWPGLRMPWRIMTIDAISKVTSKLDQPGSRARRVRLGKKGRIASRTRAEKQKLASEAAKKNAADKELQERMKKSKKNRDKKLRQREKEKVKKAAARAEVEAAPEDT
jgi:uncharacterized protein YaiL (DUF2058 family)